VVTVPTSNPRLPSPTQPFLHNESLFSLDLPSLLACSDPVTPVFDDLPVSALQLSHAPRAQLDTGASVSCTDQLSWLHDFQPFTADSPCPVRLLPATVGSDTVPHGVGFLHVPARCPSSGFLPVRTFYTPALRTTVLDERDFVRSANIPISSLSSTRLTCRHFDNTCTFEALGSDHSASPLLAVDGILVDGKAFTLPLLLPSASLSSHSTVSSYSGGSPHVASHAERAALFTVGDTSPSLPHQSIHELVPVHAIHQDTERLLWHHRLGHPSDHYLFNAHKFVKGVPQFRHSDPILDTCPTCIRAKQTKTPAGPHTTRKATVPFQGLSVDFSFAGTHSSNASRDASFVGFNGETCWILIVDHFSRYKTGATRVSKAAPLDWLRTFLRERSPSCPDKYVHLDQGGELYANPKVRDLFTEFGYALCPTGADSSHQNGPVERGHLTVANAIRALLTGANLDVCFWPYAFHHWLRIDNSLPSRDQSATPLMLALNKVDDFTGFRTFGCRVWVRPPGRRGAKFLPNSRKGVFLGFLPRTTRNILWFDPETDYVKIASHARFDEGMNDLPPADIPPNVVHLQRTQQGPPVPAEPDDSAVSTFDIGSTPFSHTLSKSMPITCSRPLFGFDISQDDFNNRAFISKIAPNSSAAALFSSLKATNNKLRGAYIIKVNDRPVFTAADVIACLRELQDRGAPSIDLVFAPEKFPSARARSHAANELNLYTPTTSADTVVHTLTIADIRSISSVRFHDDDFSSPSVPISALGIALRAIRSQATTAAEQSLGHFTRRKLKQLDTWPLWHAGELKQLDQFHSLGMFGTPVPRPRGAIVLRSHWQYHIKRDGTRRARNCCDGSPRAAPTLHRLVQTYSSCVEQPVQRLFFALCALLGFVVYGGDAKDAFAHSPPPNIPTFVAIDDAYFEWFLLRFGIRLNRDYVLPVCHALQGHPESGRLWEAHINAILSSPSFGFRSTTHDRSIYSGSFLGTPILLLRQVDDFALAAPSEDVAVAFYRQVGLELQLPGESVAPFSYLGQLTDFNGVDIHQHADRIILSCASYIDRVLRTHGWTTPSHSDSEPDTPSAPCSPLPVDAIPALYSDVGPDESSPAHQALVDQFGFSYRGLLGELLYAYVTCRPPDIGYAVITLSKFASRPAAFHFSMLKKVAKYLRRTRTWGIHYHRPAPISSLPPFAPPAHSLPVSVDLLPPFPPLESGTTLTCFLDAAHGNDLRQRRSTTGFAFLLAGGSISYKCKTQTTTATSSTEAEFYAAVTAAKQARYLRSILSELGFPQASPTPLYCDNQSAINMVNAKIPTDRSRHILIQHFAIQDWKDNGDIVMRFIPGVLNPSDDLTKPLGWVLHSRHARRLMGHYPP
jgi:hypothetical protein